MCHSSIAFFLLNLKGGGGFYCILEKLGSLGVVKPFENCKFVLTTKMSLEDRLFANHFEFNNYTVRGTQVNESGYSSK